MRQCWFYKITDICIGEYMAEQSKSKKQTEYNDQSISALKGAERVRKRPGVIFGSDGLDGCSHSFFEISFYISFCKSTFCFSFPMNLYFKVNMSSLPELHRFKMHQTVIFDTPCNIGHMKQDLILIHFLHLSMMVRLCL